MDDTNRRLVVFEDRIKELEAAVDSLADQVLQLETILTSIASHLMPGESFDIPEEEENN